MPKNINSGEPSLSPAMCQRERETKGCVYARRRLSGGSKVTARWLAETRRILEGFEGFGAWNGEGESEMSSMVWFLWGWEVVYGG